MLITKYFWSFIALCIVVPYPLMFDGLKNSSWIKVLLSLAWILIWGVVFRILDINKLNQIKEHAVKECRPDKGILIYEDLLHKKKSRALRSITLMGNLVVLLIYQGQEQRALELISIMEKKISRKHELINQIVYSSNRCLIYSHLEKFDMARTELARAKEYLRAPEFSNYSPVIKLSAEKAVTMNTYALNVLTGNINGAESYLHNQLDITGPSCERISLLYLMGIVCELEGRDEEAKTYFREGAETGGTTWSAKKCQEKLEFILQPY